MIIIIWQIHCEVPRGREKTYRLYGIIETRAILNMAFYREKKSFRKLQSSFL